MARAARWVRVLDPLTRHQFDRREDDPAVRRGRFVRIKTQAYPPSPIQRRPKHHLNLAGLSASREPRQRRRSGAESLEATEGDEDSGGYSLHPV